MKKIFVRLGLVLLIVLAFYLFRHHQISSHLDLQHLKENLEQFKSFYNDNTFLSLGLFAGAYICATALSLPGASLLTLLAGAVFGFLPGLILVSFSSTVGATLAFLSSRFLMRDSIEKRFQKYLEPINQGIQKEGSFYLFSLRLIPLFPFFVINLVMGLTRMRTWTFFWVSQIGMLAGTAVYVNAGLQLSQIESLKSIFSFKILISFALLGLFPLLTKKTLSHFKTQRLYKAYKKPKKFDYNMVVLGAGSAGLVTAYICATLKSKVALIEKNKMGGDCLNTGCVPSKALIQSAKVAHQMRTADRYGLQASKPQFEFQNIMDRVKKAIQKIEPHDSVERYTKLGVDCFQGEAKILSPWEVEVEGQVLTTKNITIATGASPFVPPLEGLENIQVLTSENLWELTKLPKKFLILGGGPIGCEMAQSFQRLGSQVTQVERGPRLMRIEDPEVSEVVQKKLEAEGVTLLLNHNATAIETEGEKKFLILEHEDQTKRIEFDEILFAVGRKANVTGFGLEDLKLALRKNRTLEANEHLQTSLPNIYTCGDVTGPYQLTHTASHQAWYCAVNALFGKFKKFKVDYSVIPWATYCDPEVATVGHNEQSAKKAGLDYKLTTFDLSELDRAITDSADQGFVRVLTPPDSDKILGATVVGQHASDLILELISAMKHGFGLEAILGTIHIYPTMGEANKYVAGNWKRAQTPDWIFKWLKKFQAWQRR